MKPRHENAPQCFVRESDSGDIWLKGVFLSSEDDAVFLGIENISGLERHWVREASDAEAIASFYYWETRLVSSEEGLVREQEVSGILERLGIPAGISGDGEQTLETCVACLKANRAEAKARGELSRAYAESLRGLLAKAQHKPCLAELRSAGWARENDEVVCFVDEHEKIQAEFSCEADGDLKTGIVTHVDPYDDCDTYRRLRILLKHPSSAKSGEVQSSEFVNPFIMLRREYDYLISNPAFFTVWARHIRLQYAPSPATQGFLDAVSNGALAEE